jgi:hypothetical protein
LSIAMRAVESSPTCTFGTGAGATRDAAIDGVGRPTPAGIAQWRRCTTVHSRRDRGHPFHPHSRARNTLSPSDTEISGVPRRDVAVHRAVHPHAAVRVVASRRACLVNGTGAILDERCAASRFQRSDRVAHHDESSLGPTVALGPFSRVDERAR